MCTYYYLCDYFHNIPLMYYTCIYFYNRAFDVHKKRSLTFKDVLLGMAALEPTTQHGGMPAEMRCRYIFRYYDKNADGFLQFAEFK